MALIEKQKVGLLEQTKPKGEIDELMGRYWALKDEHEKVLDAKHQAIQRNLELENKIRESRREIERLNQEINEINKEKLEKERLYQLALDENTELEEMNRIMMKLVYIFAKRELGL